MEIIRNILRHSRLPHPIVSLGNFDGIHLGHQEILRRVGQEAKTRQGTSLVMTFHPHPLAVLRTDRPPALILSLREKLSQFARLGVQGVFLQHFSLAFSRLSPEEFVQCYLAQAIGAEKVIIGHNFSFGKDRTGSAQALERLGQDCGFEVEIVGPVCYKTVAAEPSVVRALQCAPAKLGVGAIRSVFRGRPGQYGATRSQPGLALGQSHCVQLRWYCSDSLPGYVKTRCPAAPAAHHPVSRNRWQRQAKRKEE